MINFIKQRPVLSGIIAICALTTISGIILYISGGYHSLPTLSFIVWLLMMCIGGVTILVAGIAIVLESQYFSFWRTVLLFGLWLFLVGSGTCGLLMTFG